MTLLHATCVSLDGKGVLLLGKSGSGKSDLALRLIREGAMLVADDQVEILRQDGLHASPPARLAGLMEVRGLGIVRLPYQPSVRLHLAIKLLPSREAVERLPEPAVETLEGVALPVYSFYPFDVSATAKIYMALRMVEEKLPVETIIGMV